jgi:hypothetical protein
VSRHERVLKTSNSFGKLSGMRWRRTSDALRDLQAEIARNREAMEREFELNRQEWRNGREITRTLIAEIREMGEADRRHNDAVVGALTDLAAEIRSWGGGGAAPASS